MGGKGGVEPASAARRAVLVLVVGQLLVGLTGCAAAINAESASSLVRDRPTTPPETYSLQFDGGVHALRDALDKLAALLANPHYLDDGWKSEAVNLATLVELGYRQMEGLAPPQRNREQHAAVVRAVQDCQTLTVYVFQGINNLDKGPFDEVQQRVEFCRNRLRLATSAPGSIEEQGQPASIEAARREVRISVKRDANLRGGPSTRFPVVGVAREGEEFAVIGRTPKDDWLQINGGKVKEAWIAAFLVQTDGDLQAAPVVTPPAAAAPAAVVTTPPPGP